MKTLMLWLALIAGRPEAASARDDSRPAFWAPAHAGAVA